MPQWQYKKYDLNDLPRKANEIDLLCDAGEQGWELVTITTNSIAYFKRQLGIIAPAEETPSAARLARRKSATSVK